MKILISGASDLMRTNFIEIFQILICLIISFQLVGCSATRQANSRFEDQDFSKKPVNLNNEKERQRFEEISLEVERNRSFWKEKNISNYDFEIQRFAEGSGGDWNLTFKVRDNKTLPPVDKDNYPPPYKFEEINQISSVEKLFDYTQQMLEEGYSVNVKFNKEYGFPEDIGIGTNLNGWISIKIEKLEIVK